MNKGVLKSEVHFNLSSMSFMCFKSEHFFEHEALKAVRQDSINLAFAVKFAPNQGLLLRAPMALKLANRDDSSPLELTQLELEKKQIGLILLSDLENGEICYLNRKQDKPTDLIGVKQIGKPDFPTMYIKFNLKVSYYYLICPKLKCI